MSTKNLSRSATPDVQKSVRQVKDLFLHHAPASDYRVLAAWPGFLRIAVEDILIPVALTAEYAGLHGGSGQLPAST